MRMTSFPQKQSLAVQLYDMLETSITNGARSPGSPLAERSIAEEFGISRSPVREAISALENAGLAERRGPRDRCVAVPTARFVTDTFETWCIAEIGRTYLSCIAAPTADHARIKNLLGDMEGAIRPNKREQLAELTADFHRLLTSHCSNEYLLRILRDCERYIRWLQTIYNSQIDISEISMREHHEIAGYYMAKDLLGLIDSLHRHIRRQRNQVLAAIFALQTEETPSVRPRRKSIRVGRQSLNPGTFKKEPAL